MKNILFLLFFLCVFKTYSQDLNDRIFPKEGDSILCKITKVETNWIYYDHIGKKGIRKDYIHMSDIKSYLYNGVKRKPHEQDVKLIHEQDVNTNIVEQRIIKDTSPKDTVKAFYLDSLNQKISCLILLNKNKQSREVNKFRKIVIIDSFQISKTLFPDKILGYWLNGIFYKSFKINHHGNRIVFFAEELANGKASLYIYNGEELDKESIYIFKKQSETEYAFVQEKIKLQEHVATSRVSQNSDGTVSGGDITSFFDEEPYLQYFKSYFSDCKEVTLKFNSKWYTYNSVTTMFRDYNNCN